MAVADAANSRLLVHGSFVLSEACDRIISDLSEQSRWGARQYSINGFDVDQMLIRGDVAS